MPKKSNQSRLKEQYIVLGKLRGWEKALSGLYSIMLYEDTIQCVETTEASELVGRARQLVRVEILRTIQYMRKLKKAIRRKKNESKGVD